MRFRLPPTPNHPTPVCKQHCKDHPPREPNIDGHIWIFMYYIPVLPLDE